ncbi:MAG: metallophosphoesterase [Clostridia bacterium]|nr:metallophosphoesterase [Clostridia bacterium]
MGLKILHTADWHLDSPFQGFTEQQRQFLKEAQLQIPGKIADLCRKEDCDMVLLAGDIFDGEARPETVALLKRELKRCGVPVLIAPGNHDFYTAGSPWQEDWPENVFIFTGDLESVTIQGLDCRIYGAAFRSMDCPAQLEDFKAQGDEKYCIAVLHGDPLQRNSPYNPVTNAQVRNSSLDYLALGHVHKAGTFRSGETLCAWPGCPMGRGWDETGEKGVCIVNIEDTVKVQTRSLHLPRFYDLKAEVSEDPAQAVEAVLPAVPGSDFYRITLTGACDVDPDALLQAFAAYPNLSFRDQTEAPVEIWAEAEEDSLEGIYFGMLRKAMEDSPENARQIQLAAEISRKILSGREVKL